MKAITLHEQTLVPMLLIFFVFLGHQAGASTVVVGPQACRPTLSHFPTIQSAVNASAQGGTVLVCPGKYPEQVVISSPLTLKGITFANSSAAVISVPAGGLVTNGVASSFGPVAVQLLVQNTADVSISNLIVDGLGAGCLNTTANVELYHVGQSPRPGAITNTVVRNGCDLGMAMLIDNSISRIRANTIHGTNGEVMWIEAGANQLISNTISGEVLLLGYDSFKPSGSLVSGNKVSNGTIVLINIAGVSVEQNTVTWSRQLAGFEGGLSLLESSNNRLVDNTIVMPASETFGLGIDLESDCIGCSATVDNNVMGNYVGGGAVGVRWFNVSENVFQNNFFINNQRAGFAIDDGLDGAGRNLITNNTLSETACGISITNSDRSVYTPNSFFNVVSNICKQ
jgi:parallel beta-helix repeat protein